MKYIQKYWTQNPLMVIMALAIFVRLIAVIFARGFGMHDDHFLVIEPPQSWLDGHNFDYWLPSAERNWQPNGSSLLYPGFHFGFFWLLKQLNIIDPQVKMFLLRFITAAFSLVTVFYGYKITEKISNTKSANMVGLLLAAWWMMPWLSVRNLVEIVCIPFLIWSVWIVLQKYNHPKPLRWFFLAGILLGVAFSIRYQTIFFAGGLGLAVLFDKKWKEMFAMAFGCLISITVVQCVPDMIMWGYPFAELKQYINYNIIHRYDYFTGSFFKYFGFLLGVFIVPLGLYIFYGFFRGWKKYLIVFLPTFVFLLFHSIFPNKQERFIYSIIPFLFIVGIAGWNDFVEQSKYWAKHPKFYKGTWKFFWIINTLILVVWTTSYSKKARVESMIYLSAYPNIHNLLLEDAFFQDTRMAPLFYLGQWPTVRQYTMSPDYSPISKVYKNTTAKDLPDFVLFFTTKEIDRRVDSVKKIVPHLVYEATFEPGFVDKVLFKMNKFNKNETIVVYRNADLVPAKRPE
jgi:hypothetical protein